MIRRSLILAVVIALGFTTAARGQYGGANSITVSDTTLLRNQTVTAVAQTFAPGSTVNFAFNPPVGSATADAGGVATLTFNVPSDAAAGAHTICATGTDDNADGTTITLCADVTVSIPAPGPGPAPAPKPPVEQPLPVTGSSSSVPLTRIGILLVTAGGLVVLAARERRRKLARAAG